MAGRLQRIPARLHVTWSTGMTGSRRRRRWLSVVGSIALLIALFAAAWLGIVARRYEAPINSYRVVDDRTIAVLVMGGRRTWCRLTNIAETASEVRVSGECIDWLPLPGTALGIPVDLTVQLAQPLNDRVVRHGDGVPVRLQVCPNDYCTPSPSP